MAAITTSWLIKRTSLALSDLVLWVPVPDAAGSRKWVPKASPDLGNSGWRQTLVESGFVGGATEVHAVPDIVKGKFVVQVEAADYPTLLTKRDEVIAAFRQPSYELHWSSSDGGAQGWSCLRAAVQMVWNEEFAYGLTATLQFGFLRQPVALAGAY